MKTIVLIFLLGVISMAAPGAFAQKKNIRANIKVYGNCGMCKARIEKALDRSGIKTATWDPETKNLDVVYNSKKITEQEIHQIVASVGHDTDKVKATNEVYSDLPFCCLYRDHDHGNIQDNPGQHNNH